MELRIILESDGCLNFFVDGIVIEVTPDGCVETTGCVEPQLWNGKHVELNEEEVKEVIEVLRTILEERFKNV